MNQPNLKVAPLDLPSEGSSHIIHSEKLKQLNLSLQNHQASAGSGLIGKLKSRIRGFLLGDIEKSESEYKTTLIQYLNELSSHVDLNVSDKLRDQTESHSTKIDRLTDDLGATAFNFRKELSAGLNSASGNTEREIEALKAEIASLKSGLEQVQTVSSGLERIVLKLNGAMENASSEAKCAPSTASFEYVVFENRYRGSEEQIKSRLEVYVPLLKEVSQQTSASVLEIGPGRGELLELCGENNIEAYGVELDQGMVDYCKDKPELKIQQGDGIKHLAELEDHSLGAVIATQVIEHLPYDVLKSLISLASKKVKVGGLVIFETINPDSMVALAKHYFRDPTHVAPLHPDTMKFMFDSVGRFSEIDIKPLEPFSKETIMTELDVDAHMSPRWAHSVSKLNQNFDKLNSLLFGHQDYAIVAKVSD